MPIWRDFCTTGATALAMPSATAMITKSWIMYLERSWDWSTTKRSCALVFIQLSATRPSREAISTAMPSAPKTSATSNQWWTRRPRNRAASARSGAGRAPSACSRIVAEWRAPLTTKVSARAPFRWRRRGLLTQGDPEKSSASSEPITASPPSGDTPAVRWARTGMIGSKSSGTTPRIDTEMAALPRTASAGPVTLGELPEDAGDPREVRHDLFATARSMRPLRGLLDAGRGDGSALDGDQPRRVVRRAEDDVRLRTERLLGSSSSAGRSCSTKGKGVAPTPTPAPTSVSHVCIRPSRGSAGEEPLDRA